MRGKFQTLAKGSFTDLHICGEVIGLNISALVFKVQTDRMVANLLSLKSRVSKAVAEFDILAAVTHTFIESPNLERIGFKARGIVAVPGAFGGSEAGLHSSDRYNGDPALEDYASFGFRVSELEPIPESSSYALLLGGLALGLTALRRR